MRHAGVHMKSRGFTVWLTGLPCSGKSTIAARVGRELGARGHRVEIRDGDALRTTLCSDLGFSARDRAMNVRRIGFVARLLSRNDVAVVVAAVSPYAFDRAEVRKDI